MSGAESTTDADLLSVARSRYGRLIRVYPPSWRREHGEALLGTCLDAAAARRGSGPTRREALDLVWHGLAWRFRLVAPSARTRTLIAFLSLVFGTATALTAFIAGEWVPGAADRGWRVEPGHVGPFSTVGSVLYLIWMAAFVAVVLGKARWARRFLVGTVAAGALTHGVSLTEMALRRLQGRSIGQANEGFLGLRLPSGAVVLTLALLALLACLAPLARPIRERWLIIPGTLALTVLLLLTASQRSEPQAGARWIADPGYHFYRFGGFQQILTYEAATLFPLMVLVAALAWQWVPELLPASLILSLVVSVPLMRISVSEAWLAPIDSIEHHYRGTHFVYAIGGPMSAPLTIVVLAAAVWWRWRRGRPVQPALAPG